MRSRLEFPKKMGTLPLSRRDTVRPTAAKVGSHTLHPAFRWAAADTSYLSRAANAVASCYEPRGGTALQTGRRRASAESFKARAQEHRRQRLAQVGYHCIRMRTVTPPKGLAEVAAEGFDRFLASHAGLLEQLYAKAEAARWDLERERFAQALHRSAEHRFRGARPAAADVAAYLESLHVGDLALACACSAGHEHAWEHFVQHYRHDLYAAAGAILGCSPAGGGVEGKAAARAGAGDARARDLADSLYVELYGVRGVTENEPRTDSTSTAAAKKPGRRPLFDYFHGRSKLSTWLRAVLAQRHVDSLRASQRTESLEEADEGALQAAKSSVPSDPDQPRYLAILQAALQGALAKLSPQERLRLACYYVQELTLAQIGRILGEHEATVSRKLERTRADLRQHVEQVLRREKGLSDAQVRLCFEYAAGPWPFDLTRALNATTGEVARAERGAPARPAESQANLSGPVRVDE